LLNWAQIDAIVEPDAAQQRFFLDSGYAATDDDIIASAAKPILASQPDVVFAYLVAPDLAGHDQGWGSVEYSDALTSSDRALGELIAHAGDDYAIVVTTDHGGHGNDHQLSHPIDKVTFVVARADAIAPASSWPSAHVLDIAPTVAAIAGFAPAPVWSGRSLLDTEQSTVDYLLGLVRSMEAHSYGEDVTMLEHSLQTAEAAAQDGSSPHLVLAGLLHDVGHLFGEADQWGVADHATIGAERLQQLLPASVVEPIRGHVDAKRYLVATEPDYAAKLSPASIATLAQQGGAMSEHEAAAFQALPHSKAAIALRRFDDAGKNANADTGSVESYRPLLEGALAQATSSPRWRFDACHCSKCRDQASGQHLRDIGELDGWVDHDSGAIVDRTGSVHRVIAAQSTGTPTLPHTTWTSADRLAIVKPLDTTDLSAFASRVVEYGIALTRGVTTDPGSVVTFAEQLGFVRETNYGRLFDVRSVPDANNLAYTNLGLALHTDNPYRNPVPGVQLLHCLSKAATGGASRFADGFAAAEALRLEQPAAFATLSTTLVDFRFSDATVDLHARRPLIDVDLDGHVRAIHVNHRSMTSPPPGPPTETFFDAYQAFAAILGSDQFAIELVLEPGVLVGFDNQRVLHARTAFSGDGVRHLQGCYIDMDAVRSQVRLT